MVETALARAGEKLVEPEVALTTNAAILAAVGAGGSPAFVSERAAAADLASGRVVAVPLADLDVTREFRAVWVGGARPPAGPVRDLLAIALRSLPPSRHDG